LDLKQQGIAAAVIGSIALLSCGGNSGFPITYKRMKNIFAWTGMKADTLSFVKAYTICQQAKPNRNKYPELLSPLPLLDGSWHTISLDFIEGLPRSGAANCILVVVDKFSNQATSFLYCIHL
jgi:hypothetical protein